MKLRAYLWFLASVVWSLLPLIAAAQGLVPCGGGAGSNVVGVGAGGSLSCDICYLGELIQNIINFLIGLTIPVSAAMFAWAGVLYFTALGDPTKITRAHRIFRRVVIGFFLALAAWLIIQTIMNTLVKGPNFISGGWDWRALNCAQGRQLRQSTVNQSITDFLRSSLPGLAPSSRNPVVQEDPTFIESPPGTDNVCGSVKCGGTSYVCKEDAEEYWCENPKNPADWQEALNTVSDGATSGGRAAGTGGTEKWNEKLAAACERSSLSDCDAARAIMANECGSGNPNCLSPAGAVGLMQVLPTTACGMDSSIYGCGTCRVNSKTQNDNLNGNCSAVANSLTDPDLNMTLGTKYLSGLSSTCKGDVGCMAAGYNGGYGAIKSSKSCDSGYAYECTAVPNGYAETRKYVPNVLSTYSKVKSK